MIVSSWENLSCWTGPWTFTHISFFSAAETFFSSFSSSKTFTVILSVRSVILKVNKFRPLFSWRTSKLMIRPWTITLFSSSITCSMLTASPGMTRPINAPGSGPLDFLRRKPLLPPDCDDWLLLAGFSLTVSACWAISALIISASCWLVHRSLAQSSSSNIWIETVISSLNSCLTSLTISFGTWRCWRSSAATPLLTNNWRLDPCIDLDEDAIQPDKTGCFWQIK